VLPLVALVGRPNVGKSTLFNRIVGRRLAIVEDTPGVTRDRQYAEAQQGAKRFRVVDTGGFTPASTEKLVRAVREQALVEEGIPLRHIEQSLRVPMYRTNIACTPAGRLSGPMVVSMRPLKPQHAIRAIQITSRYPAVHGAPVHIGLPALIGIKHLEKPDYGDAIEVRADELPVFWACGVTPQSVIANVKPPFAITHAPGAMLVTDLKNRQFAVL